MVEHTGGPSRHPQPLVRQAQRGPDIETDAEGDRVPASGVPDQGENGQVTAEIGAPETRIGLTIRQSESAPGTALTFLVAA
jgi:hypothetical protein